MRVADDSLYAGTVLCFRLLWDTIYADWSKVASDQGLNVTEEQILWLIWLLKSSTVTEVARLLRRDKGTISKATFSLEESGLVLREPGADRRSYTFSMTEKGEQIRENLLLSKRGASVFGQALAELDLAEQRMLLSLMLKMLRCIEGERYVATLLSYFDRVSRER